ncbi:MAG: ribosome biogenesis factor YjgA [bacterium]
MIHDQNLEEENLPPSRSQLKREAQAVYQLARQLVTFSDKKLKKLNFEADMLILIKKVKNIKAHVARKRETQFLAKQLRSLPEEHLNDLMNMDSIDQAEEGKTRQIDLWIEILAEPGAGIDAFYSHYPADLCAELRPIVRNLQKMAGKDKPPETLKIKRQLREKLKSLALTQTLPDPGQS